MAIACRLREVFSIKVCELACSGLAKSWSVPILGSDVPTCRRLRPSLAVPRQLA